MIRIVHPWILLGLCALLFVLVSLEMPIIFGAITATITWAATSVVFILAGVVLEVSRRRLDLSKSRRVLVQESIAANAILVIVPVAALSYLAAVYLVDEGFLFWLFLLIGGLPGVLAASATAVSAICNKEHPIRDASSRPAAKGRISWSKLSIPIPFAMIVWFLATFGIDSIPPLVELGAARDLGSETTTISLTSSSLPDTDYIKIKSVPPVALFTVEADSISSIYLNGTRTYRDRFTFVLLGKPAILSIPHSKPATIQIRPASSAGEEREDEVSYVLLELTRGNDGEWTAITPRVLSLSRLHFPQRSLIGPDIDAGSYTVTIVNLPDANSYNRYVERLDDAVILDPYTLGRPLEASEDGSVQLKIVPFQDETGNNARKVEQAVEQLATPSKKGAQQTGANFIILGVERPPRRR
jgi:hypothetical protein